MFILRQSSLVESRLRSCYFVEIINYARYLPQKESAKTITRGIDRMPTIAVCAEMSQMKWAVIKKGIKM